MALLDVPLPNLTELRQFVAVANAQSFSAAARQLGLSAAALSLGIKRLEASINVRLLERSTRSVRLTEEGAAFYQTCVQALGLLASGTEAISSRNGLSAGKLTLSAPTDLTRTLLYRWLLEFMDRYPQIQLEIQVSDALSNLHRDPVDLAIRYGLPQDSTLVTRPLSHCRRRLCAAPQYLARHGTPGHPSDLVDHRCITYKLKGREDTQWRFSRDGQEFSVNVNGRLCTDDSGLARQWALAGGGLVYKSELDLAADIASGALVPVMEAYQGSSSPLFLVYPSATHQAHRVRILKEFLLDRFNELN